MARDTIVDRFIQRARTNALDPALYYRIEGRWDAIDWKTYHYRAHQFAGGLIAAGHTPGEAVAIIGNNSPEWVIADVGAMMAHGVPAGIYQTNTPEQAAFVARHCEARCLVVENRAQWLKFDAQRDTLPNVSTIVMIREADTVSDPRVVSFAEFCARGRAKEDEVDRRVEAIRPEDLATLIYTSGTTGPPKGAMLSHKNLAFECTSCMSANTAAAGDVAVSYLPLAHIAEQLITIHLGISAGYPVWFAEAVDKLRDVLLAARPTVLMGVPRVWEKLQAALEPRLAEARGAKGAIVKWARDVGTRAGQQRLEHGELRGILALEEAVARKLFFQKLAAQLGLDRLRMAVSGAAPIRREVLEFFMSCGILIHEVYGQTEGTGAATFNRPGAGETRIGTVGKPLPGIDVKIADDGEILVGGDSVFLGYFKDEAATRATVVDGYLHSGDVGEFDARGFLRITDRKKDLIITSGGKNVAPQNIEKLLRGIEGIAQAVVIGDHRNYLTALLTLENDMAVALAKRSGWPAARDELVRHSGFIDHVQRGVDAANAKLARYESVKKFVLIANDFSQETGELTPTQKVKRRVVGEKFAREIDGMYASGASD